MAWNAHNRILNERLSQPKRFYERSQTPERKFSAKHVSVVAR